MYNNYQAEKSFEKSAVDFQQKLKFNAMTYGSLESYIKKVIFTDTITKISRTELQMVLLKEVGVLTQNLRDRIFVIVDADDNGKISTQEIITFIENQQPEMTSCEHMLYVIKISVTNSGYGSYL